MNRKIPFSACIVLMLITAIFTYQITFISDQERYVDKVASITQSPSDDPKLSEVKYYVNNYFVKDYDKKYVNDAAVIGYIVGLQDPHSSYFTKEQFDELNDTTKGGATGIGIRIFNNLNTNEMTIFEVVDGSPAKEAGIQKADVIVAVNDKPYSELGYEGAYLELLGNEGESVDITLKRGEEEIRITIVRRHFEQQTVTYKLCDTASNVGYVKIFSFDLGTTEQFKNAIEKLLEMGATSFIFDVRSNPGGTLDSVSKVLDYLLPAGPIIRMVSKTGETEIIKSDSAELSAPMVVLANSSSASAAELFTSALMDYNKATFIGNKTYGKGTIQTSFKLSDGSGIRISTQYYLPPFSASFDGLGIEPDIEISISEENLAIFYLLTETQDEQLSAAIDYLKQ